MENKKDGPISSKVEGRLDEIFDEHGKKAAAIAGGNDFEGSPITGLKTTLLSIDWEISDDVLRTLIEEIGRLENVYKHDKDIMLFLQLLNSAGKYIKKRKTCVIRDICRFSVFPVTNNHLCNSSQFSCQ